MNQTGVATESHRFVGAGRGFDIAFPSTTVARWAVGEEVGALRRAFVPHGA